MSDVDNFFKALGLGIGSVIVGKIVTDSAGRATFQPDTRTKPEFVKGKLIDVTDGDARIIEGSGNDD